MKKFVASLLLAAGVISPIIAYYQRDTIFLGLGVVCDILLFVLLLED